MIQAAVVEEYELELERAKQPDYVSRYDDFDVDYGDFRRGHQPGGDTRVDAPHDRPAGRPHQSRSNNSDSPRNRPAPPPPKVAPHQQPQRDAHMPSDGFGAGIFPDE
jgi:stage V sporulation protein G